MLRLELEGRELQRSVAYPVQKLRVRSVADSMAIQFNLLKEVLFSFKYCPRNSLMMVSASINSIGTFKTLQFQF